MGNDQIIDLIYCTPEKLALEAKLNDLLETTQSIEKFEERQAEVLDYIYRVRLIRLLTRRAPVKELRELQEHLERMTHPRRLAALRSLSKLHGDRWKAYMDILENRLVALRSEAPDQVRKIAHVNDILYYLAEYGTTKQSALKKELDFKSANLTRILNLMEANDLIERHATGRENEVKLGSYCEKDQLIAEREINRSPVPKLESVRSPIRLVVIKVEGSQSGIGRGKNFVREEHAKRRGRSAYGK